MWMFKILVLGLALYGGARLVRDIRAGRDALPERPRARGELISDAEVVVVAEVPIAPEVDPEGLAGMGEGIDLDANEAANRELREQREKLPR
jgi:hypothetical protein